MGFFDHLEEFRKRLIVCLSRSSCAFLVCWYWAPQLFDFLARPVRKVLPPGPEPRLHDADRALPHVLPRGDARRGHPRVAGHPVAGLALRRAGALPAREDATSGRSSWRVLLLPVRVRVRLLRGLPAGRADSSSASASTSTPSSRSTSTSGRRPRSSWAWASASRCRSSIFFLARMGVVSEDGSSPKFKYAMLIIFIIAADHHADPRRRDAVRLRRSDDRALPARGSPIAWMFQEAET